MRNFSQRGSVFLSAEAQSKGDQTSGTHAPRNPSASKPGCGAGCIPGTGNQRRRLIHSTVPRSSLPRGPFAVGKMGQEETAIIRSLKSLTYSSPGCRASFPAARRVSHSAVPTLVPVAGSTRDGQLQGDRGAKRCRRQRHQQPSGATRLATGSSDLLYLQRVCWNREEGEMCFGCLLEEILSQRCQASHGFSGSEPAPWSLPSPSSLSCMQSPGLFFRGEKQGLTSLHW